MVADDQTWFHVRQRLTQGYVSSSLLFNIFRSMLVDTILQRFAADPITLSALKYLDWCAKE